MSAVQLYIQKFISDFSAPVFFKKNKDCIALSSIGALGWALYQHLSSSSHPIVGSHLATPGSSSKSESLGNKRFFLRGEEERMRGELDRLKGQVHHLWKNAKKVKPKSILKQAEGRKKTVQFSDSLTEVREFVRLKDGPLLKADLTAEPKAKNKMLQKEIFFFDARKSLQVTFL